MKPSAVKWKLLRLEERESLGIMLAADFVIRLCFASFVPMERTIWSLELYRGSAYTYYIHVRVNTSSYLNEGLETGDFLLQ